MQWLLLCPNGVIKLGKENKARQKCVFMILVCIELICFAGVRAFDIGADTEMYIKALNYYSTFSHDSILSQKLVYPFAFEKGYFFFTKVCAWVSMNETTFLVVIAMLMYIPVCIFIYKYSENPLISIYVYFAFSCFTYSLGIFRQMIAISIVLFGVSYIEKRKAIHYILTIFVAMTFHTTAIIMLPFYWIVQIKFKHRLHLIFLIELILLLTSRQIILIELKFIPKYENYIDSKWDVQGGSYLMLIVYNFIVIVAYFMAIREKNKKDNLMNISVCASICALFLTVLGYAMGIFGRIVPYYSIFLLVLIPKILNDYCGRSKIVVHILAVICLVVMFYFVNRNSVIVPYRTINFI